MDRTVSILLIWAILASAGLGVSVIAYFNAKSRASEQAERIAELGGRIDDHRREVIDITAELEQERERADRFTEISRRLKNENTILRDAIDDITKSIGRSTDGVARIVDSELRTAETLDILEKYFHYFFRGSGGGVVD